MKKQLKQLIFGYIPYYITKYFKSDSPNLKFFKYIKKHGYSRHLYEFRHEYDNYIVDLRKDTINDLYYVIHHDKRLYFHKALSEEKIKRMYKGLVMEQDTRSPHHYMDSLKEVNGKIFVDIGSAEGFTSLDVIENVSHIYLFEQDPQWIEALNATFGPWQEKVTIVKKYISDHNDADNQTLDSFFEDKSYDNLFLKMDIEGEERRALTGCEKIFETGKNLNFAICTYHLPDDEEVISAYLDKYNCVYSNQKGYFRHKLRSVVLRGHNSVGAEPGCHHFTNHREKVDQIYTFKAI